MGLKFDRSKLRSSQDDMMDEKVKESYQKKIKGIFARIETKSKHVRGVPLGKLSNTSRSALKSIPGNSLINQKVQMFGQRYGCWTCGKKMGKPGVAGWVADHIPPYSLKITKAYAGFEVKRKVFSSLDRWTLLPSCVDCCRKQAVIVKRLNKCKTAEAFEAEYDRHDEAYLIGGPYRNPQHAVRTTSRRTDHAHLAWQAAGIIRCHVCGSASTTSANTKYIADHRPPREFNTPYALKLMNFAGISDRTLYIMPQCVKCSSGQSKFRELARELREIGKELGFKTAKGM